MFVVCVPELEDVEVIETLRHHLSHVGVGDCVLIEAVTNDLFSTVDRRTKKEGDTDVLGGCERSSQIIQEVVVLLVPIAIPHVTVRCNQVGQELQGIGLTKILEREGLVRGVLKERIEPAVHDEHRIAWEITGPQQRISVRRVWQS